MTAAFAGPSATPAQIAVDGLTVRFGTKAAPCSARSRG